MRRAVGILSTAIVPVFIATMVFAADPYGSERGSAEHGSREGAGATAGASGYMGEHSMTGKITDIDKEKGRVQVDAQGETLELHFPQTALRNLNEGDQVVVSLGIKPAGTRSGTSGAPGSGTSGGMPGSRESEPSGSGTR